MPEQKNLLAVDVTRCQCEKPSDKVDKTTERCTEVPTVIISERAVGEDGKHLTMALCHECWYVFITQFGPDTAIAVPILRRKQS